VKRKAMSFKQLHLTKFVIKFPHSARSGAVRKAWEKAEVDKQWAETTWAKKIAAREQVRICHLFNICGIVNYIIIIIIWHAPCQCVAPLATNGLHKFYNY